MTQYAPPTSRQTDTMGGVAPGMILTLSHYHTVTLTHYYTVTCIIYYYAWVNAQYLLLENIPYTCCNSVSDILYLVSSAVSMYIVHSTKYLVST